MTILVQERDGSRIRLVIGHLNEADRQYLRQFAEPRPERVPLEERAAGPGREPLSYDCLVSWVEPAVARIETDAGQSKRSQGSGFFIGRNHLVTNFHVVEGAESAKAWIGKQRYPVQGFAACEPGHDLILL